MMHIFRPAIVMALSVAAASESGSGDDCPTVESDKYGNADDITCTASAGCTGNKLTQAQVCTGCKATFEQSIVDSYATTVGVALAYPQSATDTLDCFCETEGTTQMNPNGLTWWESAADVSTACKSSTCKNKVMNSDYSNAGTIIYLYCVYGLITDCDQGTNFADAKDSLTECMCAAGDAGYHCKCQRIPTRGSCRSPELTVPVVVKDAAR